MAVGCGTINMTILNQYKDEQVVIRKKETKTAVDIVRDVLDRILGRVHDRDPRFSHEPWASGSHAARLKVCEPNEFDYDVPLEGLPSFVWVTDINVDSPRGYHIITIKEPDLSNLDDMVEGDQLEPRLVKQTFRKLVKEAIEYSGLQRQIKQRVQGPAITLDISHKDTVISIDLVPLVPDNGCGLLPEVLSSWPRSRVWPPADKVTEMKKIGNTSVAKDDEFWLTSFGRCELELIKEIDKDDGCRKECLRILKKLREDNWRYPPNKPVLTSFHLKVLLFWQCEDHPYSHKWHRSRLPERIMEMATKLKQWLDDSMCPHYFIPDINLFADKSGNLKNPFGLSQTSIKVGKFLDRPNYFLKC